MPRSLPAGAELNLQTPFVVATSRWKLQGTAMMTSGNRADSHHDPIMTILYPSAGSISIWVGTFDSDDAFDIAAEADVEARLKLSIPLADLTEAAFEEEPVTVRELLEGFSGWEVFLPKALTAAKVKQVARANAALVCYGLRCDGAPDAWGPLVFLGTFQGIDTPAGPES